MLLNIFNLIISTDSNGTSTLKRNCILGKKSFIKRWRGMIKDNRGWKWAKFNTFAWNFQIITKDPAVFRLNCFYFLLFLEMIIAIQVSWIHKCLFYLKQIITVLLICANASQYYKLPKQYVGGDIRMND